MLVRVLGGGRVYPGWWEDGWVPGGYYRVLPSTIPGPINQSYSGLKPYPRPNEGVFQVIDEVS